jgi:hypothetical protein
MTGPLGPGLPCSKTLVLELERVQRISSLVLTIARGPTIKQRFIQFERCGQGAGMAPKHNDTPSLVFRRAWPGSLTLVRPVAKLWHLGAIADWHDGLRTKKGSRHKILYVNDNLLVTIPETLLGALGCLSSASSPRQFFRTRRSWHHRPTVLHSVAWTNIGCCATDTSPGQSLGANIAVVVAAAS